MSTSIIVLIGLTIIVAGAFWILRRSASSEVAPRPTEAAIEEGHTAARKAGVRDEGTTPPRSVIAESTPLQAAADAAPQPEAALAVQSPVPTATNAQLGVRAFMRGDYQEAFALLEPVGNEGHLRAQILLSKMYYAGHGVEQDMQRYTYWLQRAAENGDKPSKAKLKKIAQQLPTDSAS